MLDVSPSVPSREVHPVFTNVCSSCRRNQLIFLSQVTGMAETEQGTVVAYTCWCGADQAWLAGRRTATRGEVAPAA